MSRKWRYSLFVPFFVADVLVGPFRNNVAQLNAHAGHLCQVKSFNYQGEISPGAMFKI
jgi:hypothetical protein